MNTDYFWKKHLIVEKLELHVRGTCICIFPVWSPLQALNCYDDGCIWFL